jgi:hypothetical protein
MLKTLPGYDPDVQKNRAEARQLMRKLGYGPTDRLKIKVSVRDLPFLRDPAVILLDQLKEVYIDGRGPHPRAPVLFRLAREVPSRRYRPGDPAPDGRLLDTHGAHRAVIPVARKLWLPSLVPGSIKTGFVKPNSRILPAIWAIWASECVRALRA